jgi:leucyl aminopeptidase
MTSKLDITFGKISERSARICVILCQPDRAMPPALKAMNEESGGYIARAMEIAKFDGGKKAVLDLVAPDDLNLDRLIILGTGAAGKYKEEDWLVLGGRIKAQLSAAKAASAEILLETAGGNGISGQKAALVALGVILRAYEFKKYKKPKKKKPDQEDEDGDADMLSSLKILCASPDGARTAFEAASALGEGVTLARDLVNEPANVLTPLEFSRRVLALVDAGLAVEVLDKDMLTEIGMRALLAVGQGSAEPSCVAIMRWSGAADKAAKPLVLVGKGVCFDTGGISIKPAIGMEEMKGDMGGAAAVTGAMLTLARRNAKLNVIGIIGLTENMPSGTAVRPGDIVESLSGQTIEVVNTDAEGRLVLADVMWYAQEHFKPKAMITLATLTGAIIVALGKEHAGMFANDDDLAEQLSEAGIETGDKVWRLPLGPKYDKLLSSKFADMKNIGGRTAGSITAAQFLQRFVKNGTAWAHLDIAGTAMGSPSTEINRSWGSGFGVMLLDRLVSKFYEN